MQADTDRGSRVAVERVREVQLRVRVPTPPILEIAFYGGALLVGILLGAVATVLTHAA